MCLDFFLCALFALLSSWAFLMLVGISASNPGGKRGPEREELDVLDVLGLMSTLNLFERGTLGLVSEDGILWLVWV